MRSDRAAEAAPVIEEALRIARASDGERSRLAVALRAATAEAWASTGRADATDPLLDEALAIALADFASDPILIGTVYRVRAKAGIEQRRPDRAREDLARSAEHFSVAGKPGEPYLRRLEPMRHELEAAVAD